MALAILGRQEKTVELHRLAQVEDDPRIALAEVPGTNGADHRVGQGQLAEITAQARAVQVDDQALRGTQAEGLVLHRAAQIEHQPQLFCVLPQSCVADLRGADTPGKHQGRTGQQQVEQLTSVHGKYREKRSVPTHKTR
jgi:hypothetical protein